LDWGPALAKILKLDFDVLVPSKGAMITRDDLIPFKIKMEILISPIRTLVNKGVPKDRLLAQLNPEDFGRRFTFTPDRFYAELSSSKMASEHAETK
jgi:hypothetical protein